MKLRHHIAFALLLAGSIGYLAFSLEPSPKGMTLAEECADAAEWIPLEEDPVMRRFYANLYWECDIDPDGEEYAA